MSKAKILTKQIAAKFLKKPVSVDLRQFTSIEDTAAKALALHKGKLHLFGLTSLSDAASKALASHQGHIMLWDLKDISDEGLLAMSCCLRKIHWPGILTKRLKKLLRAAAPQCKESPPPEWKDGRIVLNRPVKNSVWVTQSHMSKHKNVPSSLFKWFISLLPKEHIRDVDHGFYVVQEVSDAAAGLLVENRRFFEGVRAGMRKSQGAETKAILTENPDLLKIRKLVAANDMGGFLMAIDMMKSLEFGEDAWIATLSKSRLKVICDPRKCLSGQGQAIHALLEAAADRPKLVTHLFAIYGGAGIVLPEGLKDLSEKAAVVLAQYRGALHLACLKCLSDSAAQALTRHKGELNLSGLTSLSDAAVIALARHDGNLNLCGLTHLNDAAAQALAQHKGGYLGLFGLKGLSAAAAQALARHEQCWLKDAAEKAVEQARKRLAKAKITAA